MDRFIFIIVLISSALVLLISSHYMWRRRISIGPTATYLSICMAGVAVYNFGYAGEISRDTLADVMAWVRFEYIGIQVLSPTWLLFALCLTGKEKIITPRRVTYLSIFPAFLLVSTFSPLDYSIVHINARLDTLGPFPTFAYDRGPLIYMGLAFQTVCIVSSTVLFTIMMLRAAPPFRKQAAVFWAGSFFPWIGGVIYNLSLAPHNLDITPFTLTISSLVFTLGIVKFRLMDIVPLARDVIFEGMSDGVLVLDNQERVIDFNPRFQLMLPGVNKSAVGHPVVDALAAYPAILDLLKEDPAVSVAFEVKETGSSSYYSGTLVPLYNGRKKKVGKLITLHDYTRTKGLMDQLEVLASQDSLTGVYNRRHFTQIADREIYRLERFGGALSLIMLDLDFFKRINDSYGHAAGDAVLKNVSEICKGMLRQSDVMGRFGGEEFVILLPETALSEASVIAERLREAIEQLRIEYEDLTLSLSASFGVASLVSPGDFSLDILFRSADRALYQAKGGGRNRVCVDEPEDMSRSIFEDPRPLDLGIH